MQATAATGMGVHGEVFNTRDWRDSVMIYQERRGEHCSFRQVQA